MASEIVTGVDTMALVERAWHGYGNVVGRTMTYNEALTAGGVDWTVQLAPVTAITTDGVADITTHRATVRSDTGHVLGVVGADYTPHQPAELLELARLTVDAGPNDAHIETIGSLRGGRIIFITIALPNDITIGGDIHLPRLVWVTSTDGTLATRAVTTMIRVVCANTMRASFGAARTSWATRHTSTLQGRANDARQGLQLAWQLSDTFRTEVDALINQHLTSHQVDTVLAGLWPDNRDATTQARARAANRRREVRNLYTADDRTAQWHGTAYGLIQAVSTWELWHAPRRTDRGVANLTALFAGTPTTTQHAARHLTELAN